MAAGDVIKLGTLYCNGIRIARPTYPWRGDSTAVTNGAPAAGNIQYYSDVAGSIEIRDTDASDANQMQWIEVYDQISSKTLYIADRNYLVNISWDDLNSQGLVDGKEFTINGQKYLCRLLTGGSGYGGSGEYSFGSPSDNEWDRFIANEDMLQELPNYSDIETSSGSVAETRTAPCNSRWNYWLMHSWGQETWTADTAHRVIRGYHAVSYCRARAASLMNAFHGWRPVLEVLNSAPLISDHDRDLGEQKAPFAIPYSVSEADGDFFEVFEYLNGEQLRHLTNQTSGTNYTIDLSSSRWAGLANARHTVKIVAADVHGASSERVITFTKSNSQPGASTITSHTNGCRVKTSVYIEFTPGTDPENDTQIMTLTVADNAAFTSNVKSFTGMQKNVSGNWTAVTGITNSDAGSTFRIQAAGLEVNTTKYMRIGATDAGGSGMTVWSGVVTLAVGDVLEVQTKPFETDFQPVGISPKANRVIDSKATVQVVACNNALDASPTWEDVTQAYATGGEHTFANQAKTAGSWAIALKFTVTANDATGEISISAIGAGVS